MSNKHFMNPKEDSISKYLKDVRRLTVIDTAEETRIAVLAGAGDQAAKERLITANLRFVISVAKEFQNQGLPLADLISEGNLGLLKAAERFDHTRGFKFISYAVHWIKQSILQSLYDNGRTVRLPVNIIHNINQAKKAIQKFEQHFERTPDNDEVNMPSFPNCTSYNIVINEDGDELGQLLEDFDAILPDSEVRDEEAFKRDIDNTLDCLSEREQFIVKSYYGMLGSNMTLEAIGSELNLTKERVRQIKEKAIRRIRHNSDNLFDYIK